VDGFEQPATAKPKKPMPTDELHAKSVWKVSLEPSGLQFDVSANQSVLIAALQARIRMPSSCRNGTCRTCLCMLKQGKIRYQIDWPGLTREEKAEGYMLPCVATPESDLVLDVPDASPLK